MPKAAAASHKPNTASERIGRQPQEHVAWTLAVRVEEGEDQAEKKRRVTGGARRRSRRSAGHRASSLGAPKRRQRSADGELRHDVGAQQHLDEGDDPSRRHALDVSRGCRVTGAEGLAVRVGKHATLMYRTSQSAQPLPTTVTGAVKRTVSAAPSARWTSLPRVESTAAVPAPPPIAVPTSRAFPCRQPARR